MSKFRIVMDMDFGQIAPEAVGSGPADLETIREVFTAAVINPARSQSKADLHKIRTDADMDMDVKAIRMAEHLRKIMATLMAEANLQVQRLPADHEISTELPFERRYQEDSRRAA